MTQTHKKAAMTPQEMDAAHDEARAEANTEALVRKFAARPEWALGMCSSCQEWIQPGFMCACGAWTWRRGLLTHHDEYGIEEAHQDALEVEKLSALVRERVDEEIDAAHAESERASAARSYTLGRALLGVPLGTFIAVVVGLEVGWLADLIGVQPEARRLLAAVFTVLAGLVLSQVVLIWATRSARGQHRQHPSRYLFRAEVAELRGKYAEAIASYEAYLHARGGLSEDSQSEYVLRQIAVLYLKLNRSSDSIREYERLAAHYHSKQPPDLRKASAIARLILRIDPQNQRALEWLRR